MKVLRLELLTQGKQKAAGHRQANDKAGERKERESYKDKSYMNLPHETINCRVIKEENQKYFTAAKIVWELALRIVSEDEKIGVGKSDYLIMCMVGVYVKQMRAFFACYKLCEAGLNNEGLILLRTMAITYAQLLELRKSNDQAEFARLWFVWDLVSNYDRVKFLKEQCPERGYSFINYDDYSDRIAKEKERLGDDKWKNFFRNGPAMKDTRQLFEDNLSKATYEVFFRTASGSVHGYDMFSYIKPKDDGKIEGRLAPYGGMVDIMLALIIAFLKDTVSVINELLVLRKEAEISQIEAVLNGLVAYHKSKTTIEGKTTA